jgi:predicted dehydrogenase
MTAGKPLDERHRGITAVSDQSFSSRVNRRTFLQGAAAAGLAAAAGAAEKAEGRLAVAVIGLSRGMDHVSALLQIPEVEIRYLCDVDKNRLAAGLKTIETKRGTAPKGVGDFRTILDDRAVDAIFIATCNHWHAPMTILACAAGKHVYVEKPGSHNAAEGEMIVAAARKHKRVVQMGNQRRSWPVIQEAIHKVRDGALGRVTFARCFYNNNRPSIGKGVLGPPPAHLDYDLWQGPAPEKPYKNNVIHYNWHWHWHWGGGELANNGVHGLDLARWGMGVEYPTQVSCVGGRYCYADDQETPDTGVAVYHFGDVGITWEQSSCQPRKGEGLPFVAFYGERGILHITDPGYKILDRDGKVAEQQPGQFSDVVHIADFLKCVRSGSRPNSDIEEAQKSTLLCHLGNISYRLGRTLHFDPAKRKIVGDAEALKFWGREYRRGWEPKV